MNGTKLSHGVAGLTIMSKATPKARDSMTGEGEINKTQDNY